MCTPKETASNLIRELWDVLPAADAGIPITRPDSADLIAEVFNHAADYCLSHNISHQEMSQALAWLERRSQIPKGSVRTWHSEGRAALECDSLRPQQTSHQETIQ